MENSDFVEKIDSGNKRCPKCFHDTLKYDVDAKRIKCSNCGYTVDLTSCSSDLSDSSLTSLNLDDKKQKH